MCNFAISHVCLLMILHHLVLGLHAVMAMCGLNAYSSGTLRVNPNLSRIFKIPGNVTHIFSSIHFADIKSSDVDMKRLYLILYHLFLIELWALHICVFFFVYPVLYVKKFVWCILRIMLIFSFVRGNLHNPLILILTWLSPWKTFEPANVDFLYENSLHRSNRKCQDYVYIKWEYWSTM